MHSFYMQYFSLNDGNKIPALGFGTYLIPDDGTTEKSVLMALESGYRLIDTAQAYQNETGVGKAIKASGLKREEVFIESKLWLSNFGYEKAKKGIENSLKRLDIDYIDLYILHQPYGDTIGAYKALEEAKKEGKIKSIGISNHTPNFLNKFLPEIEIMPCVNQMECNPFCQEKDVREIMDKNNILLQSWYPIGHGSKELLENEKIVAVAKKHNKSVVQVILRWHIQSGFVAIPKSTSKQHIIDNLNIFDFELDDNDMQQINSLDKGKTSINHDDPEFGKMLAGFVVD